MDGNQMVQTGGGAEERQDWGKKSDNKELLLRYEGDEKPTLYSLFVTVKDKDRKWGFSWSMAQVIFKSPDVFFKIYFFVFKFAPNKALGHVDDIGYRKEFL